MPLELGNDNPNRLRERDGGVSRTGHDVHASTAVRHYAYAPMMGNPPLHTLSTVLRPYGRSRRSAEGRGRHPPSAGPPWGNPPDRLFSRRRHAEVKWN